MELVVDMMAEPAPLSSPSPTCIVFMRLFTEEFRERAADAEGNEGAGLLARSAITACIVAMCCADK